MSSDVPIQVLNGDLPSNSLRFVKRIPSDLSLKA